MTEQSDNLPAKTSAKSIGTAGVHADGRRVNASQRKQATEVFEEQLDKVLPRLVKKALDTYERGMDSDQIKVALSAADKFTTQFHRPSQVVQHNHDGAPQPLVFNITNVDSLSAADKALLDAVEANPIEAEIIDVEAVEE